MTRKLDVRAIAEGESHALVCPHCSSQLLVAYYRDQNVVAGKYWLTDGDTIPELWDRLAEVQKTPDGFDYELLVGNCPQCKGDYYVVEANFINASSEGDPDVPHLLARNIELTPGFNYICSLVASKEGVPATWLMEEQDTIVGTIQRHTFGPWKLDDPSEVSGPYGVMACRGSGAESPWAHGRELLLLLWDALRAQLPPTGESLPQPEVREATVAAAAADAGNPKAGERGAPIPESWRGPACAAFDREMARASGEPEYGRALELVSALNEYEEMSFEPSPREQAILASKKEAMDEARVWIQVNVLHNPTIKALMYETVRDFDRNTTDPERRAFLAEMRPIMEGEPSTSQA